MIVNCTRDVTKRVPVFISFNPLFGILVKLTCVIVIVKSGRGCSPCVGCRPRRRLDTLLVGTFNPQNSVRQTWPLISHALGVLRDRQATFQKPLVFLALSRRIGRLILLVRMGLDVHNRRLIDYFQLLLEVRYFIL